MTFSKTEKRTRDYTRHGITTCFAALNTPPPAKALVAVCPPSHQGILKFMDQVIAAHNGREIHVTLDNLATHSGPDADKWLARHPNVTFYFTPTGSS
jgi:hypothetical protein